MNITMIFATIAALLIVIAAYSYLNWKAMLYLGGLFLTTAIVALFLNYQNDGITWSIPVGDDLFRHGDSVSILGEYRWLALLGLLTGVVLMIAGAVKRMRMPPPEPAEPAVTPLTEKEIIEQKMDAEVEKTQNQLGDPGENGEKDAHAPDGVKPNQHATEPLGFESQARKLYETCGTSFVQDTVQRLKNEIKNALQILTNLQNKLDNRYYAQKADATYRKNANPPNPGGVKLLKGKVNQATKDYAQFVMMLKLRPGEQPGWNNPTSTKQLIVLGLIAAIIEFVVSYLFLKDQLGDSYAIRVAAVAMVVVLMIAFFSAAIFQFMRPPHPMLLRVGVGIGYAGLFTFLLLGLGLLLEFRAVGDVSASQISGTFEKIVVGYGSMLTDIDNLVLFLINLFAFMLFYYKCLLWFERHSGLRRVDEVKNQATKEWYEMYIDNNNVIKDALQETKSEAEENRKSAERAVKELQEKKPVLESIQANLQPSLLKLRHSYDDDVNEYRKSNAQSRNVAVNPVPVYFKDDPLFCAVKEHFNGEHGIDEFINKHQESIDQSDDTPRQINQTVTDWYAESAKLSVEWTEEFDRDVQGVSNK